MRTVYVTSDVTYLVDNYMHLINKVTDKSFMPEGVEPAAVLLLRVPEKLLLKNIFGLLAIGAPKFSFILMRNMLSARINDPRVKLLDDRNIPIYRCKSVNQAASLAYLKSLSPDLIVNMRTRNIYRKPVLELPTIGCINIHHGLLPENRGTMCDLWAWVEKRPVGFSIHWMNEKIDDGHILTRCEVDVTGCKSYLELPYRSSHKEAEALKSCIARIKNEGHFVGIPNRTENINYTRTPSPAKIAEIRRSGKKL